MLTDEERKTLRDVLPRDTTGYALGVINKTVERIAHHHRAEAWDEGYKAGISYARSTELHAPTNPHKEGQ